MDSDDGSDFMDRNLTAHLGMGLEALLGTVDTNILDGLLLCTMTHCTAALYLSMPGYPIISTAFKLLEGATIFTKPDLKNTYHLVGIR